MAKRVRIVRRKVVRVSDELLEAFEDPDKIAAYCWGCSAPKPKKGQRCELCGLHGDVGPDLLPRRSRMFIQITKKCDRSQLA